MARSLPDRVGRSVPVDVATLRTTNDTSPKDMLAALFPFGDVLLLGVLIRFFIARGLRNAAFWQISASLCSKRSGT